MPVFALSDELFFPPANLTDESGIIAVGGDFKPERLLLAYAQGIFPWPHEGYPLLWFCPQERFVLRPKEVHLGRSLRKTMRKNTYQVTMDMRFTQVMKACQSSLRPGQNGTWITDEMIAGYTALHELGFAHSVEVVDDAGLVGGLYGVCIGGTFFGESMFTKKPEASKVAFATLISCLIEWDFDLVDCQQETRHLASFGARMMPRDDFLFSLASSIQKKNRQGKWEYTLPSSETLVMLLSLLAHDSNSR